MASNQAARRRDPSDELGAAPLDAERVVRVVGEAGEDARPSAAAGVGTPAGPGAGSPCVAISRRQARRASSPVTFCSRIAGTSDSSTAPVARQADAREAPGELVDEPMVVADRHRAADPGRAAAGTLASAPVRARAPRLGAQPSPCAWSRASVAGPSASGCAQARQRRPGRRGPDASGIAGARDGAAGAAVRTRSNGPSNGKVPVGIGPVCHGFARSSTHCGRTATGRPSMVRLSRRATPQGRRERGAHRPACHRRRPRSGRVTGPQPVRSAGRRSPQPSRDGGCCPRDDDDDRTPRSGGPFRRDPGSGLDDVRASPADGAAPGSVRRCPAHGDGQGRQAEPVALRRQRLVVRPGPVRQRHRVRPDADPTASSASPTGRCRAGRSSSSATRRTAASSRPPSSTAARSSAAGPGTSRPACATP